MVHRAKKVFLVLVSVSECGPLQSCQPDSPGENKLRTRPNRGNEKSTSSSKCKLAGLHMPGLLQNLPAPKVLRGNVSCELSCFDCSTKICCKLPTKEKLPVRSCFNGHWSESTVTTNWSYISWKFLHSWGCCCNRKKLKLHEIIW